MSIYRENLVPRQFGLTKPFRTILARNHYRGRHGITQPTLKTKVEKLSTTTITCVKGSTQRKVTAVKPVCPSGFKKKT
jgi:hypothetical protein